MFTEDSLFEHSYRMDAETIGLNLRLLEYHLRKVPYLLSSVWISQLFRLAERVPVVPFEYGEFAAMAGVAVMVGLYVAFLSQISCWTRWVPGLAMWALADEPMEDFCGMGFALAGVFLAVMGMWNTSSGKMVSHVTWQIRAQDVLEQLLMVVLVMLVLFMLRGWTPIRSTLPIVMILLGVLMMTRSELYAMHSTAFTVATTGSLLLIALGLLAMHAQGEAYNLEGAMVWYRLKKDSLLGRLSGKKAEEVFSRVLSYGDEQYEKRAVADLYAAYVEEPNLVVPPDKPKEEAGYQQAPWQKHVPWEALSKVVDSWRTILYDPLPSFTILDCFMPVLQSYWMVVTAMSTTAHDIVARGVTARAEKKPDTWRTLLMWAGWWARDVFSCWLTFPGGVWGASVISMTKAGEIREALKWLGSFFVAMCMWQVTAAFLWYRKMDELQVQQTEGRPLVPVGWINDIMAKMRYLYYAVGFIGGLGWLRGATLIYPIMGLGLATYALRYGQMDQETVNLIQASAGLATGIWLYPLSVVVEHLYRRHNGMRPRALIDLAGYEVGGIG